MARRKKGRLGKKDLNLKAIIINADRSAMSLGLSDLGARGHDGKVLQSSIRKKRLYRLEDAYVSR
jgi:hypothetical protein